MDLRRIENRFDEFFADDWRVGFASSLARKSQMLVGREPEAETELGIVLEQRVRPSRSAAFMVLRSMA